MNRIYAIATEIENGMESYTNNWDGERHIRFIRVIYGNRNFDFELYETEEVAAIIYTANTCNVPYTVMFGYTSVFDNPCDNIKHFEIFNIE